MIKDKVKICELPDIQSNTDDLWNIQWMLKQSELLSKIPSDSFNYWDKEDDDNMELDYGPDKYNGDKHPNLGHLRINNNGKIRVESLPDI